MNNEMTKNMLEKNKVIAVSDDIVMLFNNTFFDAFKTKLVGGGEEPLYQPANHLTPYHQIIFAHDYFASALHEISHWLVAGEVRRQQVDYGYWYIPDGRDQLQQAEFEKVEVLPQAIEWALSISCGLKFDVSSDNLSGIVINRLAFKQKVYQRALLLLETGFSMRTEQLISACCSYYNIDALQPVDFDYQGMYQLV